MQLTNAVHFAHSRDIVHCDIKPDNVLIGRFGDVYLADWGVAARMTDVETQLRGTPGYMAPELANGGTLDARTDVYLLGATLHEILTGRMRHEAGTLVEALEAARASPLYVYSAAVPAELATLANQACHVDPEQRPVSAQAFRSALARHLEHRDSAALAGEALSRLAELERLLALDLPGEEERRDIDRLAIEAHFGLTQALARWSDNALATEARARLEALLAARRARALELERAARERDPTVSARARAVGLTLLSVAAVGVGVVAQRVPYPPSPGTMVLFPAIITGLFFATLLLLRKRVLTTLFNRQMMIIVGLSLLLLVFLRVLSLWVPQEAGAQFARDSFIMTAALGTCAVSYLRWIGWVAALFFGSGVLCTLYPEHSLGIFGVASTLATVIGAAFSWRIKTR
jgi:serine/threonine-protein kinase